MKRAFYYLILLCLVACIVTGGAQIRLNTALQPLVMPCFF